MKYNLLLLTFFFFGYSSFCQTTHQVCISEVYAGGACTSTTDVFSPPNLTIAVGDMIQFTTYMILLGGYNGTHDIQFTGSPANNVMLPISTNILSPATTVTTPPFMTPGVYPMECVDGNHCFLFAEIFSGWSCTGYSVTVTGPSCTASAAFSSPSTSLCSGSSLSFTNTSTGSTSYSWQIDDMEFSTSTNSSYLFSTAGTYDIELIANDGTCLDSVTTTITVQQAADAGADNISSICNTANDSMNLNTLLVGNNATGVWAESTSSGQFNPTTGIFDASGLTAGNYIFTYTVSAIAPCVVDVATFTVTVNQSPTIDLNITPTTLAMGDSVYVDFTTTGTLVGTTYFWDFCNGDVASYSAPFYYTEVASGVICICATIDNNNGCAADTCENVTVVDDSGLDGLNKFGISVYPNPATNNFTIDLSKINTSNCSIQITDNSGRIVRTEVVKSPGLLLVERNNLATGIYNVIVFVDQEKIIIPIIFE